MPSRGALRAALFALAALLLAALRLPAAALAQPDALPVGHGADRAALDPVSGRLFVAHPGGEPAADGMSIAVIERNGRTVGLPVTASPAHVAVSAAFRRAVVVHPAGSYATLIDTDTLLTRTVPTGMNPMHAIVVEKTGLAYVLGRGAGSAAGMGTLTEIDLRSGIARTYPVHGFVPESAAANASGTRLFVVGSIAPTSSGWRPGYVQAFDTVARAMLAEPVSVGLAPRHVVASAIGEELFAIGHLDQDGGVRPTLFVLDAATLVVRRVLLLPEGPDAQSRGTPFWGLARLDATGERMYLLDEAQERLLVTTPGSGHTRVVDLEARPSGLVVNAASGAVLVAFESLGYAGVFSASGERLDSLPTARVAGVPVLRPPLGDSAPTLVNFTDLWVDPLRTGSGLFVDHQGTTLFATLFTHDPSGNPSWLFMSNGARQPDGSFMGDLYRTRGPVAEAVKNVAAVGSLRFVPGRDGSATLIYYADGSLHTRLLQRFRVNDTARECRWSVGAAGAFGQRTNFTALWSNPADPGWGLAVAHQGEAAFAVLFTYDESNRASWAVMSGGKRTAAGAFAGDLYRAASGKVERVGSLALGFSSRDNGVLRYRLSGLDFQAPIIRQSFSRLTTDCSS